MKHRILALMALSATLLTGCSKAPVNRKIEGHWKLEQITVLKTNHVIKCNRLFWGITRAGAKMIAKPDPENPVSLGLPVLDAEVEYRNDETELVLKNITHVWDDELAPLEDILPYGLHNAKETIFTITESTHKNLTLESEYAELILKKF